MGSTPKDGGVLALCLTSLVSLLYAASAASTSSVVPANGMSSHSKDTGVQSNNEPDWVKCKAYTGIKKRLEVLAGSGWDTLNNKQMGYIVDLSYKNCETTPDNQYLLPDTMVAIPLKTSGLQFFSEEISSFTNYKSATSQSMNLQVSSPFASGSFSEEYHHNKQEQHSHKAKTMRTQIRHEIYRVMAKPDATLAPELKNRLLVVGEMLHTNRSKAATHEIELIIRDFGTHITRSVTAGGIFLQESQVVSSSDSKSESESYSVKAQAAASFFVSVGVSSSYDKGESSSESYKHNVKQSSTRTYGGPAYKPNMTINTWENGLRDALVSTDRIGDPIEYAITPYAMPELPAPTVMEISDRVAQVSQNYVMFNTHPGCTDVTSPFFDYRANIEDGTLCKGAPNQYLFGGVFQTCEVDNPSKISLCDELRQENPLTGNYSCPQDFEQVPLYTGGQTYNWHEPTCRRQTYKCGMWKKKCHRQICRAEYFGATATFTMHWCMALTVTSGPIKKGYLFGGIYAARSPNHVTQTRDCPKHYYPLKMGSDISVCVCSDYDVGRSASVPFAGFFSCKTGNPLTLLSSSRTASSLDELGFDNLSGPSSWPRFCPVGYAQYLASVDGTCQIMYCTRFQPASHGRLLLHRPPYGKPYPMPGNGTLDTTSIVSPGGQSWHKNTTTGAWKMDRMDMIVQSASDIPGLSEEQAYMVYAAACAVAIVTLLGIIIACCKRRRKRQKALNSPKAPCSPPTSNFALLHPRRAFGDGKTSMATSLGTRPGRILSEDTLYAADTGEYATASAAGGGGGASPMLWYQEYHPRSAGETVVTRRNKPDWTGEQDYGDESDPRGFGHATTGTASPLGAMPGDILPEDSAGDYATPAGSSPMLRDEYHSASTGDTAMTRRSKQDHADEEDNGQCTGKETKI